MNYIINPMWFYWISVVEKIRIIITLAATLDLILSLVLIAEMISCKNDINKYPSISDGSKKILLFLRRWLKILILLLPFLLAFFVFVPAKETLVEIMISRFATYDNAQTVVESIKSAADYIIEALK